MLLSVARSEKAGIVTELLKSEARFVPGKMTEMYGLGMQCSLGQ